MISKGEDYDRLKKSFVIFICTFDPFGKGRHLYTFGNRCNEDVSLVLGDETSKVFLYKENPGLCLGFEKAFSYEYKLKTSFEQ